MLNWNIIGHQEQIKFLEKSLNNNHLNHAYIFAGPKFIGKEKIAKLFAQSIICEKIQNQTSDKPCNDCPNCKQFQKAIYSDFYEINLSDGKKDISIEQIKQLQYQITLKSFLGNYKIALINNADKLNKASANALLKTLEEPPANTIIILLTSHLKSLLPTIISRCQLLKFGYVNQDLIYKYLVDQGERRDKAKIISRWSQGRPEIILNQNFENLLIKHNSYREIIENILKAPEYKRLQILDEFFKNSKDDKVENYLEVWQTFIHDLFLIKTYNNEKVVNQDATDFLTSISNLFSFKKISQLLKNISLISNQLKQNINSKILFENLFLNI